jgi:hypothetical protein
MKYHYVAVDDIHYSVSVIINHCDHLVLSRSWMVYMLFVAAYIIHLIAITRSLVSSKPIEGREVDCSDNYDCR